MKTFEPIGYNWKYVITHPWIIFEHIYYELKYAWQRIFRGWDDRAIWSIDYYLSELIPELVLELKEITHGVPWAMFPKDVVAGEETSEDMEIASENWDKTLEKIAEGFKYFHKNVYEVSSIEEINILQEKVNESFELLSEHFMSLWD
jgi:hypothetical protein